MLSESIGIKVTCRICQQQQEIMVDKRGWESFQSGVHAQTSLRRNTPDEREMFLSQTCGTCWNKMFGEEE